MAVDVLGPFPPSSKALLLGLYSISLILPFP